MMRISSFFAFCFVLFLFSCRSQQKITNYLQNVDTSETLSMKMPEPHIQKNDLLSIKVYSQSADPRTDIPYNLPEQNSGVSSNNASSGFLVNEQGDIEFPRLGIVHVEGLTKTKLAQILREKLSDVLMNPSVIVRFLNYRITVLGEVKAPGNFSVPTERVTVLEALGMAGDITDYGKRDSIKIAREVNGQIEVGYVNLASGDLFNSPYFRLQQNDVVFVPQLRRKLQSEERQVVLQQIAIVSSILTGLALIINFLR